MMNRCDGGARVHGFGHTQESGSAVSRSTYDNPTAHGAIHQRRHRAHKVGTIQSDVTRAVSLLAHSAAVLGTDRSPRFGRKYCGSVKTKTSR